MSSSHSMVCDGCAETIRTALMALPGVRDVEVSLWRARVCCEPHLVATAQIKQAIACVGYPVGEA